MANEIIDLRKELKQLRFDMKFLQKIDCSKQDNKKYAKMIKDGIELPDGVFQYKNDVGEVINEFYTIYDANLTEDEKQEYIQYQKLKYIKTIKNCVVFFTVLTVISIIITAIVTSNLT